MCEDTDIASGSSMLPYAEDMPCSDPDPPCEEEFVAGIQFKSTINNSITESEPEDSEDSDDSNDSEHSNTCVQEDDTNVKYCVIGLLLLPNLVVHVLHFPVLFRKTSHYIQAQV